MTTNNSLNLNFPINIPNGGLGSNSLTANTILCSGTTGTGSVQSVTGMGTTGSVLSSGGAGALPSGVPPSYGLIYQTDFGGAIRPLVANKCILEGTSATTGFNLPATAAVGDVFTLMVYQVANTSYNVQLTNTSHHITVGTTRSGTTTGITVSGALFSTLIFVCSIANTEYVLLSSTVSNIVVH